MKSLVVVIPVRSGGNPEVTLRHLARQTFQDFDIVVSWDNENRGANWARNRGFNHVNTPFVLFSDDDIRWERGALEHLYKALQRFPQSSYSYGTYEMGGRIYCNHSFDPSLLQRKNYISTMSMIRCVDFPGFDESVQRLQDWDLWLSLLDQGKTGAHCSSFIFRTDRRSGITFQGAVTYEDAAQRVKEKHNLLPEPVLVKPFLRRALRRPPNEEPTQ